MPDYINKGKEQMKRFIYTFLQLTWGLLQSIAGFVVFLLNYDCPHHDFHGAICTKWKKRSSMSLGLFIFVTDDPLAHYKNRQGELSYDEFYERIAVHEYGHTIQSLIFGPLYLLLVGVPSYTWANHPKLRKKRREEKISYYSVYPEKQANFLGELVTGLKSPGQMVN